jgi:hypothetical protein
MNKKTLGSLVAIAGVIVLAISLLADSLGIGSGEAAMGIKQIAGIVAGVALAIVGIVFAVRK